ncbi:MAG: hypothetical protein LBT98_02650 [Puniceicoccales bacterium]|jgi:hypothetical protein|nr:hypothetical protein [Puniceicoccales bacterium]
MGVPISFSPTLPRVVAGISAGTTVLALAGVVTAAVLIFTASFAVLWPLLIGCACVAAIGLVVLAIAGFLAWPRKALAKENEGTGMHYGSEKNNITELDNSKESNSLNNQNVAPKTPALEIIIGQQENDQVPLQVVNCVQDDNVIISPYKNLFNYDDKATYSEFELTLTAEDAFLSTLQPGDTLYIRGNFCGLSWAENMKVDWDRKQDIKLRFRGDFIINNENFLCNGEGVPCAWKFLKNDSGWEAGSNRILRLPNSMDG